MASLNPSLQHNEVYLVDPFLVEALHNPRHRLTVLRMEMDIQRFVQNPYQKQFEFQHLPTSYLRCAAHRVAQHYGLQTMVADSSTDGFISQIIAVKTPESRYPAFTLSDIPTKLNESNKTEVTKIAVRRKPNEASQSDASKSNKKDLVRTVEEREEEYEKARARIFNSTNMAEEEVPSSAISSEEGNSHLGKIAQQSSNYSMDEHGIISPKDVASRVAILKDREKDLNDPDYDRSYDRYARGMAPEPNFGIGYSVVQPPFVEYKSGYPHFGQFPGNHSSLNYSLNYGVSDAAVSTITPVTSYRTPGDSAFVQWPTATMMYARSYDHLRHGIFQAPQYHQPLSFEHFQNQ